MFHQKRDSFCQGFHFDRNRSATFLIFFFFWIKNLLFIYFVFIFDRKRWVTIFVEIAKVKEEINNTSRNFKSNICMVFKKANF